MATEVRTISGKRLVVIFTAISLTALVGILLTFRFVGWTRFIENARLVEGKQYSVYLARNVMACGERTGVLPPSSGPVPSDFSLVAARSFRSNPADWSADAFSCNGFVMKEPQRFQYEWQKIDEESGVARARGDFNGDGVPEAIFEQDIACKHNGTKLTCRPGNFHDIAK